MMNQLSETDGITSESRTMTYDAAGHMSRLVVRTGDTIALTQKNVYNGNVSGSAGSRTVISVTITMTGALWHT